MEGFKYRSKGGRRHSHYSTAKYKKQKPWPIPPSFLAFVVRNRPRQTIRGNEGEVTVLTYPLLLPWFAFSQFSVYVFVLLIWLHSLVSVHVIQRDKFLPHSPIHAIQIDIFFVSRPFGWCHTMLAIRIGVFLFWCVLLEFLQLYLNYIKLGKLILCYIEASSFWCNT